MAIDVYLLGLSISHIEIFLVDCMCPKHRYMYVQMCRLKMLFMIISITNNSGTEWWGIQQLLGWKAYLKKLPHYHGDMKVKVFGSLEISCYNVDCREYIV